MINARNTRLTLIGLVMFCTTVHSQHYLPDTVISVNCCNTPLEECLEAVSAASGVFIAFPTRLIDTITVANFTVRQISLPAMLDSLLPAHGLTYSVKNRQVFLRKLPDKLELKGQILNRKDSLPVPYASLSLKGKPIGTISDFKGIYIWEVPVGSRSDTVVVSSMGFERYETTVHDLEKVKANRLYLESRQIEIEPVIVRSRDYKYVKLGNRGNRESGSLYIDTHGQQTSLYLLNEEGKTGDLVAVSYYLSDEGNTQAPFRIRLYSYDSLTGMPGEDILDEILVVTPAGNEDWYTIDMREYEIEVPDAGLFVGIEGIFPNDYSYYTSSDEFIDITNKDMDTPITDEYPVSVSYGQRLGYNRRNARYTWHYSLSHTWFQLQRQQYGVMIQAEVRFENNRKKIFRRNHEK